MSTKRYWRMSAWASALLVTFFYCVVLPVDVPRGDEAFQFGYRIGFYGAMAILFFIPTWLAKVLENRITKE